ncbi:MAG: MFS transporter, partial [Verrucomicrobia bacterium]|nr:MFS transporter [Verrucomicrobiota bacterium]
MKAQVKGWIVCLVAACFFCYELVQLHMLNAISPMLMKDLSLSATDFSALCSTYLLADVIFLIPAGIILDRVSVRKVILIALGLCIVGTFGFAFSTTMTQAAVSHFLSGIGNAFCFLSCMMLANSWFGKKSSFVMGVI